MINTDKKFQIVDLNLIEQPGRGSIVVFEEGRQIPFTMKRGFVVFDVPADMPRGGHAHKDSWQMHFCIGGTATITLDEGLEKETVILDSPRKGLLVAPMVWGEFKLSSPHAALIVASSDLYSEKDYIRDREEFLALIKSKTAQ